MVHRKFEAALRKAVTGCESPNGQIPPTLIFVFGFKQAEIFEFYMFLAVVSALHHNRGWKAIFIYCHEPLGKWWDRLKTDPRVIFLRIPDFSSYRIARIRHYAHKADIVRLIALRTIGGVYLDIDTITLRSFSNLQRHSFVMGIQADAEDARGGLCNAIMLSSRNAPFAKRWLKEYNSFNSRGRDKHWDLHSVKLPAKLSFDHPEEITVMGYDRFFWPLWHDVDRMLFEEGSERLLNLLSNAYVFHLWNNMTQSRLSQLDERFVATSTSCYAAIVRSFYATEATDA